MIMLIRAAAHEITEQRSIYSVSVAMYLIHFTSCCDHAAMLDLTVLVFVFKLCKRSCYRILIIRVKFSNFLEGMAVI